MVVGKGFKPPRTPRGGPRGSPPTVLYSVAAARRQLLSFSMIITLAAVKGPSRSWEWNAVPGGPSPSGLAIGLSGGLTTPGGKVSPPCNLW